MARRKSRQTPNPILPAHDTKHLPRLEYTFGDSTFRLAQSNDGSSNGTALWMGAQVLSAWLAELYGRKHRAKRSPGAPRPRAIELGSGIGLTALVLCALGWDVLATDLPVVIDSVLSQNIADNMANLPSETGSIQVRALDWNMPPADWNWESDTVIADNAPSVVSTISQAPHLTPPFDLIITADTVYSSELVTPLLRTLQHLSSNPDPPMKSPPINVCLERRDSLVIDRLLDDASVDYNTEKVSESDMLRAMSKHDLKWQKEDWDGLEIWKLARKSS